MRTLLSKTSNVRFIDPDHGELSVVLWFDTPEDKTAWLAKLRAAHVTDDDIAVARALLANWESR
jgi:hypothetical protein